jgi:hypothetical protein
VPTTLMARFRVVATFCTSAGSTTLHWEGRDMHGFGSPPFGYISRKLPEC